MCGIAGFIDTSKSPTESSAILSSMTSVISHRGPDDEAFWFEPENHVALGFRRLSIIDLTETGNQPMHSACGRYTLIFNGEIYNFKTLKEKVAQTNRFSFTYRGHSDTEVLLSSFTVFGIAKSLEEASGMFGLAVWDHQDKTLTLARDRMGEKPLYYTWTPSGFVFGSELKSICAYPDTIKEIDRNSLSLYFRHSCVPAPYTIYKNIYKLMPGTFLTLSTKHLNEKVSPRPYWSAKDKAYRNIYQGTFEEAALELETLITNSVKNQMQSDVPLGAFLSGGIDSSLIVALMQKQNSNKIKTFTIGFEEDSYNEAGFALEVAKHLKTSHTEYTVTSEEARNVIPKLPRMYDEPFADASQIPTYLVSKLARSELTVSLSGDGGDEIFGGYNRYIMGKRFWEKFGQMNSGLKQTLATALSTLKPKTWDTIFKISTPLLPSEFHGSSPGERIQRLIDIFKVKNEHELYVALTSHWNPTGPFVLHSKEPSTLVTSPDEWPKFPNYLEEMMYLDMLTYLPDDVLTKVDRASMAVSLEVRAPFLDHRIVEFALSLPTEYKIQGKTTKRILREILYKYVPQKLIDRPKMGFSVPIDSWLRGPLKEWASDLLSENKIKKEGYLNQEDVTTKWQEHISGSRNWQHHLWDILMFEAWLIR